MLRPRATYALLAREPAPTVFASLLRPAFFALLIGACVGLSASGSFTLRLLLSTTVLWSFAPTLQLLAAAALVGLLGRGRLSLVAGLDLYFLGIGPWSLWLIAVASLYSFAPPERTATWLAGARFSVLETALIPLVWSAAITFGFLRGALGLDRRHAALGFALHAALVWGPVILFFLVSGHLLPRLTGLLAR